MIFGLGGTINTDGKLLFKIHLLKGCLGGSVMSPETQPWKVPTQPQGKGGPSQVIIQEGPEFSEFSYLCLRKGREAVVLVPLLSVQPAPNPSPSHLMARPWWGEGGKLPMCSKKFSPI